MAFVPVPLLLEASGIFSIDFFAFPGDCSPKWRSVRVDADAWRTTTEYGVLTGSADRLGIQNLRTSERAARSGKVPPGYLPELVSGGSVP